MAEVVAALVLVGLADVFRAATLVDGAAEDEAAEMAEFEEPEKLEDPPGPDTLVVSEPLSMYTPEKCQSSAAVSLRPVDEGRRRTPKCQSAPLDDAVTETGETVSLRSSPPVE